MGIVNASTLRVQAVGQTHTVKMPHYLTFVCIHQILPPNQNWDGATPMLFGFAPIKEPFGCFFHLNCCDDVSDPLRCRGFLALILVQALKPMALQVESENGATWQLRSEYKTPGQVWTDFPRKRATLGSWG